MQINPQSAHLLDTSDLHLHKFSAQTKSKQYGQPYNDSDDASSSGSVQGPTRILSIPSESLTHITAFLDPSSLFALGRASKLMHEHIEDDNTWHSAFACQFLGERPESSQAQSGTLIRRSEETWKREFVLLCNLIRRWERCRNGAVTHTPHYSPIAGMHLLSDRSYGPALLSVSLQYGIIARSLPLSGKVLKGFLSATDGAGFGIGNPNAEFSPNVSACAVSSEGWTARVVWGFGHGEVALASAMRIMEIGRSASKVVRCHAQEQHRGRVVSICWHGMAFVTAGEDGEVRVWDAKRMRCVYVLQDSQSLIPDACIHVKADLERGIVLATKRSGYSVIWIGISIVEDLAEANIAYPKVRVPAPTRDSNETSEPLDIFMDPSTASDLLAYGILFSDDAQFYRVNVDLITGQHELISFVDGPLAPVQVIHPLFKCSDEVGGTVIFAGDALGRVSLFKWSATPEGVRREVSSFRRLDAYQEDEGISALVCNQHLLAVGSSQGVTKIYDTLTLRLLREFSSPAPKNATGTKSVTEMILRRDLLLVAVGERILAWEAKPVRPQKPLRSPKKRAVKGQNPKWHKRIEMAQDITESRKVVDDAHVSEKRSHQRRRAQQAALAGLGLDESEALEYVLMLSRDDELQKSQLDEGVFDADFDDIRPLPSGSQSTSHFRESRMQSPSPPLRPTPSPSTSPEKVQVSPPLRPEPMQAGGLASSPLGISMATLSSSLPALEDTDHFPTMSSSASTGSSIPRTSPAPISGSWSARLKAPAPALASSKSVPPVSLAPANMNRRSVSGPSTSGPSLLSENIRLHTQTFIGGTSASGVTPEVDGYIDADLKLALELSLAEALSLGQT